MRSSALPVPPPGRQLQKPHRLMAVKIKMGKSGVKAFRSTISTGQDISGEMAVFIGMIVVFNLLSLAVFVYKTKKGKNMISAEVAVES